MHESPDIRTLALQLRNVALELRTEVGTSPDELERAMAAAFEISRYPTAVNQLAPIIEAVVEMNPDSLSREGVGLQLMYDVVLPIITGGFMARFDVEGNFLDDVDDPDFQVRIEQAVSRIATADWRSGWRETLCVGLVTTAAFEFGGCQFVPIGGEELNRQAAWLPERVRFATTTRVGLMCPGDDQRRTEFMHQRLTVVLRTLAGACWPEMVEPMAWPLRRGVQNDIPATVGTGYDPALQVYRTHDRFPFDSVMMTNQGMSGRLKLPDLPVRLWDSAGVDLLSRALADGPTVNPLQQRLVSCLYWLGEALRPEPDSTRIVRVVTAAEALLGKDTDDGKGNRSVVCRLLPELVARVSRHERHTVLAVVERAFKARNDVLHRGALVRAPLIAEFGGLVWVAARAFADLPASVSDWEKLNNEWVPQRRRERGGNGARAASPPP